MSTSPSKPPTSSNPGQPGGVLVTKTSSTWENVVTGGGGGFIPGIVFSQVKKGLAFVRTDIGGLYRLKSDDSWVQVLNYVNTSNENHWGVDALALDSMNERNVFVAVGKYTNSWDPKNGSILRSTNGGDNWSTFPLPFKVGGNMPGRGMGERLAVDPKNSNVLYFGARSGNGLWKSSDMGRTWGRVTKFPNVGNYVADPSDPDGYKSDKMGITWITYDPNAEAINQETSTIFIGVADKDNTIYVTKDAGASWSRLNNQPTGFLSHKCKISKQEKTMYVTYSNGTGPFDGTSGAVWKYHIPSGTWTNITPIAAPPHGFGGLAIDVQKPGTLMVVALNIWYPDAQIWRSTNSGASWTPIWEWTPWPDRKFYYTQTNTTAPWVAIDKDFKTIPLGWMIESLEIDPFDSNHWLYGTGKTVFGGRDLTSWDTKRNVAITVMASGIEETSVKALICPPGGPPISLMGDVGGFIHNNVNKAPDAKLPFFTTSTSADYAGQAPKNLVRTGALDDGSAVQIATSTDGGLTWALHRAANASYYGGSAVISAQGNNLVWSTKNSGVFVSQNGAAFTKVSSLAANAKVASDKVNNLTFYGAVDTNLFKSIDGGKTFSLLFMFNSLISSIVANPTVAGDIWVSSADGLFHSLDYGNSWFQAGERGPVGLAPPSQGDSNSGTASSSPSPSAKATKPSTTTSKPTAGWSFALGKGSGEYGYNIYGFFTIDGITDMWTSSDAHNHSFSFQPEWRRMYDVKGFGDASVNPVAANPTGPGVYVGTNGRGVFFVDPGPNGWPNGPPAS